MDCFDFLQETLSMPVWILMNVQQLFAVKMLFVLMSLEVMIVVAKKISSVILMKFVQRKMMKKGMICVKLNSVDQMLFAI